MIFSHVVSEQRREQTNTKAAGAAFIYDFTTDARINFLFTLQQIFRFNKITIPKYIYDNNYQFFMTLQQILCISRISVLLPLDLRCPKRHLRCMKRHHAFSCPKRHLCIAFVLDKSIPLQQSEHFICSAWHCRCCWWAVYDEAISKRSKSAACGVGEWGDVGVIKLRARCALHSNRS